jgi:TolB-like protein/Tfp pilus assembly protein PilF/tRNA A-37 threonylcarbamoyl transferase component Bud32
MQVTDPGKINAVRVCGNCGSKIFADAPEGFCSVCLFKTALDPSPGDEGFGFDTETESPQLKFEDYELLGEIKRGGQGIVYRARQKSLNRIVALKVLGPRHWATEVHLRRFRLEAEAAACLNHPRIVPIHEIGECNGCCYYSMALIEGGPLDKLIEAAALSPSRAAELIAKLARTVHYAHERGILHRDIKPGNVLIDNEGEPHLTDFGLARLVTTEEHVTQTSEVLGTPSFMAPEQASGHNTEVTAAADIYALGAVFYHLLTASPPFLGSTHYETIRLVLEKDPIDPRSLNPKVDRDLSTICLKCLEKDPDARYHSALALAEDIERWQRHEPVQARRTGMILRGKKLLQRHSTAAFLIMSLVGLAAAIGVIIAKGYLVPREAATGIAVLPFQKLGDPAQTAALADGIQDEIIAKLARIGHLKVISRTSVMSDPAPHDVRQTARTLDVSHVLEGTVRRDGEKVSINTKLIDARIGRPIWSEEYNLGYGDILAVEGEIAEKAAQHLGTALSPEDKALLQRPPTADLKAFDLFTRARNIFLTSGGSNSGRQDMIQAASLLTQAIARDPSFLEAYCQLAWIHGQLYVLGHDHTPERLAAAEAAVEAAFKLNPDAGEAHIAHAQILYRGHLDYPGALAELEQAATTVPNDPHLYELKGYILRRMGKQKEALNELKHAIELDPRNVGTLGQVSLTYGNLRRYAEAQTMCDRILEIDPNDVDALAGRAFLTLAWKADTKPWHDVIDSIRRTNPADIRRIADSWLTCALDERDVPAAKAALIAAGDNTPINVEAVHFNRPFAEAIIARLEKDEAKARSAFAAARAEQEKTVAAEPDYAPSLCALGLIDAGLGRRAEALREGQRAVDLLPPEKDAINGPVLVEFLAMIAAWTGNNDLACEQLARASRYPGAFSYGELKLWPLWDPLRDDPRFERIVDSLAPR